MHQAMRARIGVVSPDDAINDDEFWQYLPERVNLLFTRYRTNQRFEPISSAMVDTYAETGPLRDAAETLRITRPNAVFFCCNSCSFVRGPGYDLKIIEAIEKGAQAPATTITTAQVEALRLLGLQRVGVGGPYPQELTDRLGTFLTGSGFQVTGTFGLGMKSEWEIGNADPSVWCDLARRVNSPEAQGIVLACSGIRTSPILDDLEAELGKPVISAPAVVMWRALRMAGIQDRIPGRGQLLANY
jgi:maleate isomerase